MRGDAGRQPATNRRQMQSGIGRDADGESLRMVITSKCVEESRSCRAQGKTKTRRDCRKNKEQKAKMETGGSSLV